MDGFVLGQVHSVSRLESRDAYVTARDASVGRNPSSKSELLPVLYGSTVPPLAQTARWACSLRRHLEYVALTSNDNTNHEASDGRKGM